MTPIEIAASRALSIAARTDVPYACSDCCDPARGRTKLAALVPALIDEVERLRAENERIRGAAWESFGVLGSLDLQVGDVIDEDDVRLYASHVDAIQRATKVTP